MKEKKTRISIFTTKWGHYSIAKAVQDSLEIDSDFKIKLNFIPVERLTDITYLPAYRIFPRAFKYAFKAGEQEHAMKIVNMYFEKSYKNKVEKLILEQKPQFVINTYAAFNQILENLSTKHGFVYINIVPDPRTFHKLSLTKIGHNFVFDKTAEKYCLNTGISKKHITVSGWFVRKEFSTSKNNHTLSKKLGLEPNVFTVLVMGGSSGNYSILKTLPAYLYPKDKLQVVVICGDSKALLRSVKITSEVFSSDKLKLVPKGYVENVNEYIKVSNLVLGKAGPNLLFETIACKKPFIAVSHIHGQEDGNLEIIKEYKLGITEEDTMALISLLRELINNPIKLDYFGKSVVKMRNNNSRSGSILRKFINSRVNAN